MADRTLPWTWLPGRLAALDPVADSDEVMRLLVEHQLDDTRIALSLLVTTAQTALPPAASATFLGTGKLLHRGEQRHTDGRDYLVTWLRHGARSPETAASVQRLNRYHLSLATRFPGAFDANDDYVYTLCAIGTFVPRMRATLGLPPQPEHLDVAWHRFLADLAGQFVGEHGPVTGFPDDMAGMLAFAEAYEARPWPPTDDGHVLVEAMVQQYCDRFFPPAMHWFARAQVLLLLPPRVREVHGLGAPRPRAAAVVRRLMRAVLRAQETWWPTRRTPLSQRLESPRVRRAHARRARRMQRVHDRRVRRGELPPPPVRPHG